MFEHEYAHVFDGDKNWQSLSIPTGGIYQWDDTSTYIKKPPYFDNMVDPGAPLQDFHELRVLALLGDSVTTESFERIHRTNLVGMGVLPLQFQAGESAASLQLTGAETYHIEGVATSLYGGGGAAPGGGGAGGGRGGGGGGGG